MNEQIEHGFVAWLVMRYDQEEEKEKEKKKKKLFVKSLASIYKFYQSLLIDELSEDSKRIMLFGSFVFVSVNSIERGIMY